MENHQLYVRKCSDDKTLNKNSYVGCSYVLRRDNVDPTIPNVESRKLELSDTKLLNVAGSDIV